MAVWALRAASSSTVRATGSRTTGLSSNGVFHSRRHHCSRMPGCSVGTGNTFARSLVFGVCASIIAPAYHQRQLVDNGLAELRKCRVEPRLAFLSQFLDRSHRVL